MHILNKKVSFKELFSDGGNVSEKAKQITDLQWDLFEFMTGSDVKEKYAKFLQEATSEQGLIDRINKYHDDLGEYSDEDLTRRYAKKVWEQYHGKAETPISKMPDVVFDAVHKLGWYDENNPFVQLADLVFGQETDFQFVEYSDKDFARYKAAFKKAVLERVEEIIDDYTFSEE